MNIIGVFLEKDVDCVCVSEMIEIVGELEESMDRKVSDSATLLLKGLSERRGDGRKGNDEHSLSLSGLTRQREKERREKEQALKENERLKKENENALKENERVKRENEKALKENERLKQKLACSIQLPSSESFYLFSLHYHFLFLFLFVSPS
jgi:hypothetical protein